AKPIHIPIEGITQIPHFSLRNIPDLDLIMKHIKQENPQHATIVGAGYIGLEVAENLVQRGIEVTMIEKANEILPIVDEEMAVYIRKELENRGVNVYTDTEIVHIKDHQVTLKSGINFKTDFLITAVGVLPDTKIVSDAGIKTGLRGGIHVDKYYMTSHEHIYAVGDAIIVKHQISCQDALIPLASPANRQGRQLADILSGQNVTNKGTLGTSIVKVFNLSLASTGLNEKQLVNQNYKVMHLNANDHASYYPNATPIYLKVIFDPESEMILGAQAVGEKGVDKRMDVIATAIKCKMKVTDLQELELSYAPPFGSAKDIINLAGYVASNIISGITKTVQWYDVKKMIEQQEDVVFLDVRNSFEREAYGYIKDSINLDVDQLAQTYEQLPKNKKIITYCDIGTKGYHAELFLRSKGYEVYNLDGAYNILSNMLKEHIYV
ncbi:MAG: CoA-disulfide reductase, partial [Bacillota bacterium]